MDERVRFHFDGQVAVVTGGASGIGAATARLFAASGAHVVIASRATDDGDGMAARITQAGGSACSIPADVADSAQVQAMVAATIARFGRVDILVNNAGIGIARPFWELDDDEWRRLLDVNVTGQFLCAKYIVPHLLRQGGGAIVNLSSVLAQATNAGMAAYSASKAAIIGMTRAMALDLAAKGVRVNCILPGSIDTPMMWDGYAPEELPRIAREAAAFVPIGRVAPPEEIASAVLFLASPAASLITGTALVADGGLLAKIATAF